MTRISFNITIAGTASSYGNFHVLFVKKGHVSKLAARSEYEKRILSVPFSQKLKSNQKNVKATGRFLTEPVGLTVTLFRTFFSRYLQGNRNSIIPINKWFQCCQSIKQYINNAIFFHVAASNLCSNALRLFIIQI